MTHYSRPTRLSPGQLLWLELQEFENRPKVAVRVYRLMGGGRGGHRVQVELLTGKGGAGGISLVSVDVDRLYEETEL